MCNPSYGTGPERTRIPISRLRGQTSNQIRYQSASAYYFPSGMRRGVRGSAGPSPAGKITRQGGSPDRRAGYAKAAQAKVLQGLAQGELAQMPSYGAGGSVKHQYVTLSQKAAEAYQRARRAPYSSYGLKMMERTRAQEAQQRAAAIPAALQRQYALQAGKLSLTERKELFRKRGYNMGMRGYNLNF